MERKKWIMPDEIALKIDSLIPPECPQVTMDEDEITSSPIFNVQLEKPLLLNNIGGVENLVELSGYKMKVSCSSAIANHPICDKCPFYIGYIYDNSNPN